MVTQLLQPSPRPDTMPPSARGFNIPFPGPDSRGIQFHPPSSQNLNVPLGTCPTEREGEDTICLIDNGLCELPKVNGSHSGTEPELEDLCELPRVNGSHSGTEQELEDSGFVLLEHPATKEEESFNSIVADLTQILFSQDETAVISSAQ